MNDPLLVLIKDIHYTLDQTRIFSLHTHRPYFLNGKGEMKFTNMGEDNQIAKNRIDKLISDCGKMMDRVNDCIANKGYEIIKDNKDTLAVLHDLCNYSKHVKKEKDPIGNFKPSISKPNVSFVYSAKSGGYAGVITMMDQEKTSFWDIGDNEYAYISIKGNVLDENKKPYKEITTLVKDSLKIWVAELKKVNIDIPDYIEPDTMIEAANHGQHASLFVETYADAYKKGSYLTSEKRFDEAAVLYNYALTKCVNNEQRAICYGCMGLSYEDAEEFIMAQASYWTALRYNPNQPGLHVNFGNMCDRMGDRNAAKAAYLEELKLKNGHHENARTNLRRFQ